MSTETAVCRRCRMALNGKPHGDGGGATHPRTGNRCPVNYYGGYVCSEDCDRRASLELESSMPGAGPQRFLSGDSLASLRRNWK